MNGKQAILLVVLALATFVGATFADTISSSPTKSGLALQTTSTDIEVVKFAGVLNNIGNNYVPLDVGVLVGNLTLAFSFSPYAGFQQINSVRASTIYQSGQVIQSCQACGQPNDMFTFKLNGQSVGSLHPGNSNIPNTSVLALSGLRSGSNVISIAVTNLIDPFPGFYYVYELRLTVEYTFLA